MAELSDSEADGALLEDVRRAARKAARLRAEPDWFDAAIGKGLSRYEIVGRIGEGGMGVVYAAEQKSPRRRVAIKVVKSILVSPELERRFANEVEALARLDHPGIARVLEADTFEVQGEKRPYFAMELVNGVPLDCFVEEEPDLHARLELFVRICAAVAHAHQKGVLHRDLKPSNILVTVDGQPKILDFGIARPVDTVEPSVDDLQTRTGQLLGTLPYMSPEQVSGNPDAIDTRTDVYGLGLILFRLLSGRMPYDVAEKATPDLVRIVSSVEPLRLRAVDPRLPRDLDTIASKALEKDPVRRYSSVEALAEDVRRYLRDEPITARPPSRLYQLGKFTRRNKGVVVGLSLAFAILIAGAIVSTYQALRAHRAGEEARLAGVAARRAEEEARREARTEERVNEFMAHILGSDDAFGVPRPVDFTVREAIDEAERWLTEDLGEEPLVEATMRVILGRLALERGERERAVDHLERALRLRQGELGGDHLKTAAAANGLGVAQYEAGNVAAAERYLRRAIEVYTPYGGDAEVDQQLGATYMNLSRLSIDAGELSLAEEQLRKAIELHEKSLGERDPWVARDLAILARVRQLQGRPQEVIELMRDACAIHRASDTPDSLAAAHAFGFLAAQLDALARYEDSVELWEEAARIQAHLLGPEDDQVGRARHRLGRALVGRKDYVRAQEELTLAVENLRLHEELRELLAQVLYDLGRLELKLDDPERALEFLCESADLCARDLAPDHELARRVGEGILEAERSLIASD